jgi:hypothetical protein
MIAEVEAVIMSMMRKLRLLEVKWQPKITQTTARGPGVKSKSFLHLLF